MNSRSERLVVVSPYSRDWPRLFREEKERIRAAVGDNILDIQHIGSTSIPGMVAKPIIDIAVAVSSFEEARRCIKPLEAIGYFYRGEHGIPRRHYFVKGTSRTHHLHMLEGDSAEWRNHLGFRDRLRESRLLAEQYASLKESLASRFKNDVNAYQDGKAFFIQRVLNEERA